MPKLSDTHFVLLSQAAKRNDGAVLPISKRLDLAQSALNRALKSLLRKNLVTEAPALLDAPAWRETKDQRFMLTITAAGLEAIGVEANEKATEPKDGDRSRSRPTVKKKSRKKDQHRPASSTVKPGTKIALLVEMLSGADGASIGDVVDKTGWQPHSVRGAISGTVKKKLGLNVTSEVEADRGRVYRIVKDA